MANASLERLVDLTISLMQSEQELSAEDIAGALGQDGADPEIALQLLLFVPLAFARHLLANSGVAFPDRYILQRPTGDRVHGYYSAEPVYQAACRVARARKPNSMEKASFFRLVRRDAEFNGINRMVNSGSSPQNVMLTEAAIFASWDPTPSRQSSNEESAAPLEFTQPVLFASVLSAKKRPWWKLW